MKYQICNRCVMDISDPEIVFDKRGICNHCTDAIKKLNSFPFNVPSNKKERVLKKIIKDIKKAGKNKKYDCVMGISGGVDSTYALYLAKKEGLSILAVHLDNGWNSELSVRNIENALKKLNIDLYTHVIDWKEFKDIQLSFLKAGVPDLEIPTDHAIFTILFDIARKFHVKYVLTGENFISESILPRKWSFGHTDWKYIRFLQKKYGSKKIRTFPINSYFKLFKNFFIYNIKWIRVLNYANYKKEEALKIIEKELDYERYNFKHGESTYTLFIQNCILPKRFGFDKRKAHFSSLIASNQMTRKEALKKLETPLLEANEEKYLIKYVCDKFEISKEEFDRYINLPIKTYFDYPNMNNQFVAHLKKIFLKYKIK